MSTRNQTTIFLCEPHCRGFEHAQFNAALIASVRVAFPETPLVFMGEASHLQHVRSWMRGWPGESSIEYRVIAIEDPAASYVKGTMQRVSAYRAPLGPARKVADGFVIYCSTAPKGILLLKLLLWGSRSSCGVLAIFHNQLARLIPSTRFNDMNLVLAFPQPRPLTFLVLGESIREVVTGLVEFRPGGLIAIDHPSLRAGLPLGGPWSGRPVCFGFLGVSLNKGLDDFASLARRLHESGVDAKFSMVGMINHSPDIGSYCDILPDAGSTPITEEEYRRRMEALTYVVWTAPPADYELRASATFVDAMAYGKPGIYLRNRYVEYYFRLFGDIGYLCDDVDSMFRVMREVGAQFPRERYMEQLKNIATAREGFSPERVGMRLRNLLRS